MAEVRKPEACEGCVRGSLHEGTAQGSEALIGGVNVYHVGEANKSRTILFLTDIFGYKLINCRLLADDYASAGFYVIVPDLFAEEPIDVELLPKICPYPETQEQKGLIEKGTDKAETMAKVTPFMLKHRDGVVNPIINRILALLRADPEVKKIGSIGFCWGGRHTVLLCDPSSEQTVDCAVAAHPSGLSIPGEIKPIARPILFEVGSIDPMMSEEDAKKVEEAFAEKKETPVPYKIEIFPGMVHGFAIRGDLQNAEQREARKRALELGINWFQQYLQ
eukprot:TRINITY_DN26333_c0_g1_i1.p1 TRINITY_DN26333_c0_g1~~TRINITY_DN26333_c0_g1_i1.p1  ORF type:complete len:277 (-),score=53.86 TRINITY_DN26333_c0_g1_i1:37-867(-)